MFFMDDFILSVRRNSHTDSMGGSSVSASLNAISDAGTASLLEDTGSFFILQ